MIIFTLFIGVGAFVGGVCMLIKPDGSILQMQPLLPYFQVLPFAEVLFQNYIFPGISLIIVNGVTNFVAAAFIIRRKKAGSVLSMIFGITLMLWIVIQFFIFPANALSITYFIFGAIEFLVGYASYVFYSQEHFHFDESDYDNIGKDSKKIVVYFSRLGYVKKAAYEKAQKEGACIYEIKTKEKTCGTSGFWWCGRFALHGWGMENLPCEVDFSKYDHVTICSPVWAFHLCSVVKEFCINQKGKIKEADYIIVHFQKARYDNVINELDNLLGIRHTEAKGVCSRLGKVKKQYKL